VTASGAKGEDRAAPGNVLNSACAVVLDADRRPKQGTSYGATSGHRRHLRAALVRRRIAILDRDGEDLLDGVQLEVFDVPVSVPQVTRSRWVPGCRRLQQASPRATVPGPPAPRLDAPRQEDM